MARFGFLGPHSASETLLGSGFLPLFPLTSLPESFDRSSFMVSIFLTYFGIRLLS